MTPDFPVLDEGSAYQLYNIPVYKSVLMEVIQPA